MACRIPVPQAGIKPGSMEVKARVLTTRISCLNYFKLLYNIPSCVSMIISLFILSKNRHLRSFQSFTAGS